MKMKTPETIEKALNELVSMSLSYEEGCVGWDTVAYYIDRTCGIIQEFYTEQKETEEALF